MFNPDEIQWGDQPGGVAVSPPPAPKPPKFDASKVVWDSPAPKPAAAPAFDPSAVVWDDSPAALPATQPATPAIVWSAPTPAPAIHNTPPVAPAPVADDWQAVASRYIANHERLIGFPMADADKAAVLTDFRRSAGLQVKPSMPAAQIAATPQTGGIGGAAQDYVEQKLMAAGRGMVDPLVTGIGAVSPSTSQYLNRELDASMSVPDTAGNVIARGAGNALTSTAAALTGSGLAGAVGIGATGQTAAGMVSGFGLGSAGGAGQYREEVLAARQAGQQVSGWKEALGSLGYAAAEGVPEALSFGVERVAGKIAAPLLRRFGAEATKRILPQLLARAGVNLATNVGEELATQILENAISRKTTNPNRPLTEGFGNAALGGLGGGLVGTGVSVAEDVHAARQQPQAVDPQILEAEALLDRLEPQLTEAARERQPLQSSPPSSPENPHQSNAGAFSGQAPTLDTSAGSTRQNASGGPGGMTPAERASIEAENAEAARRVAEQQFHERQRQAYAQELESLREQQAIEGENREAEHRVQARQQLPTFNEQQLREMPADRLRAVAQAEGVAFDSPSLTIPRVLDAQSSRRFEGLSNKQLWDEVRRRGLRAGSREANIRTLIDAERAPAFRPEDVQWDQPAQPAEKTVPPEPPSQEHVTTPATAGPGPAAPAFTTEIADASRQAGAGRPARVRRPASKFTRAWVENELVNEIHRAGAGEQLDLSSAQQEDMDSNYGHFTFYGKLPGEVRNYLEGRAHMKRVFRVTDQAGQAGGADAMSRMGEDAYFAMAEKIAGDHTRQAVEFAEKERVSPRADFLAAVWRNLPPSRMKREGQWQKNPDLKPQQGIDPAAMPTGSTFDLHGERFEIVEDDDGYRVLKDGRDYPVVPADAVGEIPADKGSVQIPPSEASEQGLPPMPDDDPFAGFDVADVKWDEPTPPQATPPQAPPALQQPQTFSKGSPVRWTDAQGNVRRGTVFADAGRGVVTVVDSDSPAKLAQRVNRDAVQPLTAESAGINIGDRVNVPGMESDGPYTVQQVRPDGSLDVLSQSRRTMNVTADRVNLASKPGGERTPTRYALTPLMETSKPLEIERAIGAEITPVYQPDAPSAMRKDLFGGSFIESSGIGQQAPMFHEPNAMERPPQERIGSRNATDPRNTTEMFPPRGGADEAGPAQSTPPPPSPSTPPVAEQQPARPSTPDPRAASFRKQAETLARQIEDKRRPMAQNPTPKRNREYNGRIVEAGTMERTRRGLIALADARDAGTLPPALADIKSRAQVQDLLRKKMKAGQGYYDVYRELDEYENTSPAAKALQSLIDKKSPEQEKADTERAKAESIRRMEDDVRFTKIEGFFPTPPATVAKMMDAADIQPGMNALEPSAGKGDIADAMQAKGANVSTVEIVPRLRDILKAKGHNLAGDDFLQHRGQYDRVVMNPPFERGRDIEHVRHAYELLKPGGKLVALMSEGSFGRSGKKETAFRQWLDSIGGTSEKLDAGAFKGPESFRQTGVASRMVVIDKPAAVRQASPPATPVAALADAAFNIDELTHNELKEQAQRFGIDPEQTRARLVDELRGVQQRNPEAFDDLSRERGHEPSQAENPDASFPVVKRRGRNSGFVDVSALETPVAVGVGTAQWLKRGVDWWSKPLVDRVSDQAGPVGKDIGDTIRRAHDLARATIGELSGQLHRTLAHVAGRTPTSRRAVGELQNIRWEPGKDYGFSTFQLAVEDKMDLGTLSPAAQQAVRNHRKLMERTGEIAVREGFKTWDSQQRDWVPFTPAKDGKRLIRSLTPEAFDILARGKDDAVFKQWANALADANGVSPDEALRELTDLSEGPAYRRNAVEMRRVLDRWPTHLKVKSKTLGLQTTQAVPLIHAEPFDAAANLVRNFAMRVGYVRTVGQDLPLPGNPMQPTVSDVLIDRFGRAGGDRELLRSVLRAANGVPVNRVTMYAPGTPQHLAIRAANSLLSVVRSGALTMAFVPNVFEPFSKTMAFSGFKEFARAYVDMAANPKAVARATAALGGRTIDVMNLMPRPGRKMEFLASATRILNRPLDLVNELNEMHAARVGIRLARRLQDRQATSGDRARLRMLDFTEPQINRLLAGTASADEFQAVVTRFAERTQGSTSFPGELSMAQNTRWYRSLVPFERYPQMTANRTATVIRQLFEAIDGARSGNRTWSDVQSHARVSAKYFLGSAASGSAAMFLLAYLFAGKQGFDIELSKLKDDPTEFVKDALTYNLLGGMSAALYRSLVESDRRDVLSGIGTMALPVSLLQEGWEFYNGVGAYKDRNLLEKVQTFFNRRVTASKYVANVMGIQGLGSDDPALDAAVRAYYQWRRDEKPLPGFEGKQNTTEAHAQFRIRMRRAQQAIAGGRDAEAQHWLDEAMGIKAGEVGSDDSRQAAADSLRGRKLLDDLDDGEQVRLRNRIGQDAFDKLRAHDDVIEGWIEQVSTGGDERLIAKRRQSKHVAELRDSLSDSVRRLLREKNRLDALGVNVLTADERSRRAQLRPLERAYKLFVEHDRKGNRQAAESFRNQLEVQAEQLGDHADRQRYEHAN